MTKHEAEKIIQKIVQDVFGVDKKYEFDEFAKKFAYDISLPVEAIDAITGKQTWAASLAPKKFISMSTVEARESEQGDWMYPKESIESMDQLLNLWNRVNYWATDHVMESDDVAQSDSVYRSQHVFRSIDVRDSDHVVLTNGATESQYIAASKTSNTSTYCIRLNESKKCSSSFDVSLSGKVVKSLFVHDAYDLYECLFCSHITGKKYCIANMQFEQDEYFRIKKMVIDWLLNR